MAIIMEVYLQQCVLFCHIQDAVTLSSCVLVKVMRNDGCMYVCMHVCMYVCNVGGGGGIGSQELALSVWRPASLNYLTTSVLLSIVRDYVCMYVMWGEEGGLGARSWL